MDDNTDALVADDEPFIRMGACDMLVDAGFRCLEAGGVEEAPGLLEEHAPDVTLLFIDVNMDGERDGFELARVTAERWSDIKILVASGAVRPQPGEMPDGAVFIAKPFSADVVHTRLQERCRMARSPSR